jgi:hypothetical protein
MDTIFTLEALGVGCGMQTLSLPKRNPLPKESGMSHLPDDTHWAVTEFADAELGDARRMKRVVELATALAQHPTASLPEACGTGARRKAAYRFFANDAIEPQDLLQSHVEATYSRLEQRPLVLAVQDTTEVDWTSHRATTGLGPLGYTACQGPARPSHARMNARAGALGAVGATGLGA